MIHQSMTMLDNNCKGMKKNTQDWIKKHWKCGNGACHEKRQ